MTYSHKCRHKQSGPNVSVTSTGLTHRSPLCNSIDEVVDKQTHVGYSKFHGC